MHDLGAEQVSQLFAQRLDAALVAGVASQTHRPPHPGRERLDPARQRGGTLRPSVAVAVQCYPGRGSNGRDTRPSKSVRQHGANRLGDDIESYSWRRIVVFGEIARQSIEQLGYGTDDRFCFVTHPNGGLKSKTLDQSFAGLLSELAKNR